MKGLTTKQATVLDFIRSFILQHHYPPTMREMIEHFGWKSTNAAVTHLEALIGKGRITRDPAKARCIRIVQSTEE